MGMDSAKLQAAYAKDFEMLKGDSLMAVAKGEAMLKSWMNIEGGAYEVNGKGSLMVGEPFLFRNLSPAMRDTITKADFENEFKRTLGVTNVIWLGEGLAEDEGWGHIFDGKYSTGGTRGHADEFARFVNPTTIFLAWVDDNEVDINTINKLNYARMRENYQRLLQARDQDGKPFTIVKIPIPDLFSRARIISEKEMPNPGQRAYFEKKGFRQGDTIYHLGAGSYLNFLITNDKVIIPFYTSGGSSQEKEARVRKIFSEQFPDKKLEFINASYVNLAGGGIHCITRQVPAKKTIDN
jgi:agmatine deiminase